MDGVDKIQPVEDGFKTEFEQMYEESLKQMQEGELVKGFIVKVTSDSVVIDIGCKSEGVIPIREFADADGIVSVEAGEEVSVLLERWEDDTGHIVLSKAKADQRKVWDELVVIYEADGTIDGTIVKRVNGGFHVDIGGVIAFLPNSQVDLKPVRSPDALIGTGITLKVIKYNRKKNNVIVSRRVILEGEREILKKETLENIEEGSIVKGIVKNITDYGAFVDLGGIDGLVHLSDLSWGKVSHPSQVLDIDEEIEVKVLKFDKEEGKISLGYKQTKPDPWQDATEKYAIGTKVSGNVVNITDYGAFVEIEQGLEGLVHISEMSWTKIKHPSQKLKQGDTVDVMVLDLNVPARRISLGLKQVEDNPWNGLADRYPNGTKVKGLIKNITDFGIFVGVEEGIDGLVHISDMSWTKLKHPSELFKKGQEVEAVVLNIDKNSQRFSLSTKLLEKDPWKDVEERYRPGGIVEGRVTSIADFGAFVELEEGLEGLVHVSELNRGLDSGGTIEVGDLVEVEILNVNPDDKKIGLSIRCIVESSSEAAAESPEGDSPEADNNDKVEDETESSTVESE
ncbi:MAG: 30S ribosomal protein S1 [Deltaproteobacteria bacterium]|nr:30S ribosomal protein S1 [Deltaproteobacteria bacterium]